MRSECVVGDQRFILSARQQFDLSRHPSITISIRDFDTRENLFIVASTPPPLWKFFVNSQNLLCSTYPSFAPQQHINLVFVYVFALPVVSYALSSSNLFSMISSRSTIVNRCSSFGSFFLPYDEFIFLSWLTVRCNRCCIMLLRSKLAFPTLL